MGVTIFDVIMFFVSLAGGFLVWDRGFFGEVSSKASYLIGLLFSFMLSSRQFSLHTQYLLATHIMPM